MPARKALQLRRDDNGWEEDPSPRPYADVIIEALAAMPSGNPRMDTWGE
jgi:hypothetical protein